MLNGPDQLSQVSCFTVFDAVRKMYTARFPKAFVAQGNSASILIVIFENVVNKGVEAPSAQEEYPLSVDVMKLVVECMT